MKEIEDDTKKWKDISCSWVGKTNIAKVSYSQSNLQIKFNTYQNTIFHRTRTKNSKICLEPQKKKIKKIKKTLNRQSNLKKKKKKKTNPKKWKHQK